MTSAWGELVSRLEGITDLVSAVKLFEWDQASIMPAAGGPARARASSTLEGLIHERLTDPKIGDLLSRLEEEADALDEQQRASVRVLKRDYEKATKVPEELVKALAIARGNAYQAWAQARPADDFSILQPQLETLIDLKKQEADALGWEGERYDALLDQFEPGMKTAEVQVMFDELVDGLRPIVDAVLDAVDDPPAFLARDYDEDKQMEFCRWLIKQLDFDLDRGRLDTSPHPFTIAIGIGDVRQTTRAEANALMTSIYATIHETGHALYEQGIPDETRDLPIGTCPSLGIHESQSRMWENQVGRSRAYTDFLLPHLKERFPEELGMVDLEEFYRGVNHPRRTLIRVTADELTYNLHVALRFELEIAMFRDELDVADLPDAWDAAMEKYVGIRPTDHADGVLQDMHWSISALGYFPTYTLGTIYSAAFFAQAEKELGDLSDELRAGATTRLFEWLREKVHRHGYMYDAKDLAEQVVGGPVTATALLDYLRSKYGELYSASI
ncbi:MAG: carboxypeptidase M32 [Actinomycetota bacterium]|nr:carboxypeptidase M32 [Actinomycetota bacterium]